MTRAGYLLRPVVLASLILWIVNDHVLKATFASWWTGKLSDVVSLIVFPLVPYAAIDLWRARRDLPPPPMATLAFWIAATGLVMATINTIGFAADAYRWGLATAQWPLRALYAGSLVPIQPVHLTEDPTDLLTLPALIVPWCVVRSAWKARGAGVPLAVTPLTGRDASAASGRRVTAAAGTVVELLAPRPVSHRPCIHSLPDAPRPSPRRSP